MSDTILRQWTMLRRIKRGQRTGTQELKDYLEKEGFEVGQRTIQRDLVELAKVFPGLNNDGHKPAGWFWEADAEVIDIPGINPSMALSFKLVESFLKPLLPPVVGQHLQPYFTGAEQVLGEMDDQGFAQWNQRVRILPRSQPLLPAKVDTQIAETIYQCLFEGKRFTARYKPRERDEAQYDFNPLALIFRESIIYLVATLWDYEDPRHFALHRFTWIEPQDQPVSKPEGFDLDSYLASGSFDYPTEPNKHIRLVAQFKREAALHLEETPLSEDQVITPIDNGEWVRVEATVLDTQQLRWWLLGFGKSSVVTGPNELAVKLDRE
ncbi:MAG: WYL domain-containing protein [Gammaproteobacteria bacterium SHHR-1]